MQCCACRSKSSACNNISIRCWEKSQARLVLARVHPAAGCAGDITINKGASSQWGLDILVVIRLLRWMHQVLFMFMGGSGSCPCRLHSHTRKNGG